MEEDRGLEVFSVSEAPHPSLDGHDLAVEPFGHAVGDFVGAVADHVLESLSDRPGVPASQLVPRPVEEGSDPNKRLASLVGHKLHLKVIEIDRDQNRLILSERVAERQWRKQQKAKMLSDLKEGEERDGKVISLADFGAFVDIGGVDGLVHVSEVSWQPINRPGEVLTVGQKVRVRVLKVDPGHERVALSIKRCEPDPWSLIEARYKDGQQVDAQIT